MYYKSRWRIAECVNFPYGDGWLLSVRQDNQAGHDDHHDKKCTLNVGFAHRPSTRNARSIPGTKTKFFCEKLAKSGMLSHHSESLNSWSITV